MAFSREPITGHKARIFGFFIGPLLALLLYALPAPQNLAPATWHTAPVAVWMIAWWVSEAVPLAVTALLPVVFFPIIGVMTLKDTLAPYANPVVFLFLGGFILAAALQKTGLHRRMALFIVRLVGTKPDRLVLGFMAATAFLGLWVSAIVAAILMLPMALSLIGLMPRGEDKSPAQAQNFATCLLLGIAYGASIGGMGTLIGAPSNAFVKGLFSTNYGVEISFLDWMDVGVPMVIALTLLLWVILVKCLFRFGEGDRQVAESVIRAAITEQGPLSRAEKIVGVVFLLTVAGWMGQEWLSTRVAGLTEAGIAMAGAVLLFLIPLDFRHNRFVLSWEDAGRVRWDVLVLIGGGLTLATGIDVTGLAQWIANGLAATFAPLPHEVLLLLAVLAVAFTAEFMSNIATAAVWVPILAPTAIGLGENPLLFVIPATLAASMAFVLPSSTAHNALVFGTGQLRRRDMLRGGLTMEIVAVLLLAGLSYGLLAFAMQVHPGVLPDWANSIVRPDE
jgi:sodium-dependent dicarboxylate transporter 2/3/5